MKMLHGFYVFLRRLGRLRIRVVEFVASEISKESAYTRSLDGNYPLCGEIATT